MATMETSGTVSGNTMADGTATIACAPILITAMATRMDLSDASVNRRSRAATTVAAAARAIIWFFSPSTGSAAAGRSTDCPDTSRAALMPSSPMTPAFIHRNTATAIKARFITSTVVQARNPAEYFMTTSQSIERTKGTTMPPRRTMCQHFSRSSTYRLKIFAGVSRLSLIFPARSLAFTPTGRGLAPPRSVQSFRAPASKSPVSWHVSYTLT